MSMWPRKLYPQSSTAPGTGTSSTSPTQLSECDSGLEWASIESQGALCRNDSTHGQLFCPSPDLSQSIIEWCLDAFFKHKHPITPILHRERLEANLGILRYEPDIYSLLASCCAVVSLSPEILSPAPGSHVNPSLNLPSTDFLIAESLRARNHCDLADGPSLTHVQTSFFLFSTYFCLSKDNAAWYYLREAMTMLQTLRLHEEITYASMLDKAQAMYSRRMYWVLFITERAYALQRHRPLTLRSTLELPTVDGETTDAEVLPGFLDLISLFRHFDTDFIETWNSAASSPRSDTSSAEPMSRLQNTLKQALPSVLGYSEMQQADLLISRQWLKVMVWQLCVSRTLLTNTDGEESMSLRYPVTIARDAVLVSHLLPVKALEANGVGILEKIFDIGCSLADILAVSSSLSGWSSSIEVSPVDTLFEIVRILGSTLGGGYRHLNMLTDKVGQCLLLDVAPSLPPPALGGEDEEVRVVELEPGGAYDF